MAYEFNNNRISEWRADILEITGTFKDEFGALTLDQLNWKVNPKSWSIAQVMDHLITINNTYRPLIAKAHEGNLALPFLARIGFIRSFFEDFILKSVKPENKRKTKTFPIWEPSHSDIDIGIRERFENHQHELIEMMEGAQPLLEKKSIIYSPASKTVVYSLERAFDIIVTHEKRHLNQAMWVKKQMDEGPPQIHQENG